MKLKTMLTRGALIAALLFMCHGAAAGQTPVLTSSTPSVNLSLNISESLTLNASTASAVFGAYNSAAGTASATPTITLTTAAILAPSHNALVVMGGFTSNGAALTGASGSIPASDIFASVNGGTAGACSNATPSIPGVSGATLPVGVGPVYCGPSGFIRTVSAGTLAAGGPFNYSDTVALSISGAPGLVPGNYTGTITFVAAVY